MASDDEVIHDNRREFRRQRGGAECTCVFGGRESRAVLVDASCGGAKLRFDEAEIAMAALLPVPCDIIISDEHSVMPATVMWAGGAFAGCQFHQHLSLDEVARMMTGHFRLEVPRSCDQTFGVEAVAQPRRDAVSPAERDSDAQAAFRLEAELEARIKAMIDADIEAQAACAIVAAASVEVEAIPPS
ncbi:PilZ domain-containing protein [Magnetospirillum sp. 15-1]|uniref:PilZ domain-containing protein n=1 Tax=Magnetospirillum sp. 15-1 TaxID=1979370 RepID=UPI000BBC54FF|nr:PilZ domain-containing protein [Magnetospirillum sp. 15-1]